jgi:predicted outer membrane repeat protein
VGVYFAPADGGAAVSGSALLMQDDAVITGNSAGLNGGGVIVLNDGENIGRVTMSGSAAVRGNTSQLGGGIMLQGELDMSDNAMITGNTATEGGGGVYGNGDDVELSWDKDMVILEHITGNTAPEYPDTNFTFD